MIHEPFTVDMDWSWKDRWSCFLQKPELIRTAVRFLNMMDKVIELADKPSYAVADEWKALTTIIVSTEQIPLSDALISMVLPRWETSLVLFDFVVATRDAARQAVALRLYRIQHGRYPDRLADLVPDFLDKLPTDPFSGGSYVYRKEGKGFIIYSLGNNMIDDAGTEDATHHETGDITWKSSR